MSKGQPVIIVKKKGHGGHGHHGGAWKVAYADFVTAMMAFFLVLWIVGQSRPVKAGVAGYFRDPGVLENARSNGILPGGNEGVSPNTPPNLQSSTGKGKSDEPSADAQAALRHAGELLRERLARMPELAKLQKQVEIQLTRDGLRIELIETSDSLFFDTGSAALKGDTVKLLGVIATELGSLQNSIVIEGHSDSRRYSTSGIYSNWELSSDRANAARRVMEQEGLHPNQISEVRGYADTRLRVPADPLDARNRRVSIIVSNMPAARSTEAGASPPPSTGTVDLATHADVAPAATEHGKKEH